MIGLINMKKWLSIPNSNFRTILTALHLNENSSRSQAVTKHNQPRYSVVYPKAKGGAHTLRTITEDPTYGLYFLA